MTRINNRRKMQLMAEQDAMLKQMHADLNHLARLAYVMNMGLAKVAKASFWTRLKSAFCGETLATETLKALQEIKRNEQSEMETERTGETGTVHGVSGQLDRHVDLSGGDDAAQGDGGDGLQPLAFPGRPDTRTSEPG
jgi:hypothetical protein